MSAGEEIYDRHPVDAFIGFSWNAQEPTTFFIMCSVRNRALHHNEQVILPRGSRHTHFCCIICVCVWRGVVHVSMRPEMELPCGAPGVSPVGALCARGNSVLA